MNGPIFKHIKNLIKYKKNLDKLDKIQQKENRQYEKDRKTFEKNTTKTANTILNNNIKKGNNDPFGNGT